MNIDILFNHQKLCYVSLIVTKSIFLSQRFNCYTSVQKNMIFERDQLMYSKVGDDMVPLFVKYSKV